MQTPLKPIGPRTLRPNKFRCLRGVTEAIGCWMELYDALKREHAVSLVGDIDARFSPSDPLPYIAFFVALLNTTP